MKTTSTPQLDTVHTGDAVRLLNSWPTRFADVVVCDPPYGNDTAYGRKRRRIIGDEHPLVGLQGVAATYRALKSDSTAYVFCSASHVGFLEHFFLKYSQFRIKELLVWDKGRPGFGSTFRRSFECVLVLEKGLPRYRGTAIPTVLAAARADTKLHPHAKPIGLLERLIALSSDPGDVVLDPFAGSGSTGVAANRLGRHFVGIEIAPEYAEIARGRLHDAA